MEPTTTRIVFAGGSTGGHLYPALAIATALTEVRPDVEPYFVGAERGIEARVLPEKGLPHTLVAVEGLRRGKILGNVRVLRGRSGRAQGLPGSGAPCLPLCAAAPSPKTDHLQRHRRRGICRRGTGKVASDL